MKILFACVLLAAAVLSSEAAPSQTVQNDFKTLVLLDAKLQETGTICGKKTTAEQGLIVASSPGSPIFSTYARIEKLGIGSAMGARLVFLLEFYATINLPPILSQMFEVWKLHASLWHPSYVVFNVLSMQILLILLRCIASLSFRIHPRRARHSQWRLLLPSVSHLIHHSTIRLMYGTFVSLQFKEYKCELK